jgi:hypothetical protein
MFQVATRIARHTPEARPALLRPQPGAKRWHESCLGSGDDASPAAARNRLGNTAAKPPERPAILFKESLTDDGQN